MLQLHASDDFGQGNFKEKVDDERSPLFPFFGFDAFRAMLDRAIDELNAPSWCCHGSLVLGGGCAGQDSTPLSEQGL
jgi:hypothetical protein